MKPFLQPLKNGIMNGLSVTYLMAKVIIPCYIIIEFVRYYDLIRPLAHLFKPAMKLLDLPGEVALGLLAGFFINLYAAIAILAPLNLSSKDITVCALILGICHSLTVETPVTKSVGVNYTLLLFARIVVGFFAGWGLNFIWKSF
jgi:hypothetical protein